MYAMLVFAGLSFDFHPDMPLLLDLHRFPPYEEVERQEELRKRHGEWIEIYPRVCGWHSLWDAARKENEEALEYWALLKIATDRTNDAYSRRRALRDLADDLGPYRYSLGWTPPLLRVCNPFKMPRIPD